MGIEMHVGQLAQRVPLVGPPVRRLLGAVGIESPASLVMVPDLSPDDDRVALTEAELLAREFAEHRQISPLAIATGGLEALQRLTTTVPNIARATPRLLTYGPFSSQNLGRRLQKGSFANDMDKIEQDLQISSATSPDAVEAAASQVLKVVRRAIDSVPPVPVVDCLAICEEVMPPEVIQEIDGRYPFNLLTA